MSGGIVLRASGLAPLSWGIYRNIPFAMLGLLVIVLFYRSAKEQGGSRFPLDVADDCVKLWVLYSGSPVGRRCPCDWYADDSQNVCLCMDGTHWIFCYEKRMLMEGTR